MPNFGVVVFPGSNCDHDCYHVLKKVLGQGCEFVWHEETDVERFDCIVIPGGFSYGDYLRSGSIAQLSPIMSAVKQFAAEGKPVIGICNGFQVLVECGLLPGSLMKNASLKFVCKWVHVRIENNETSFTNLMNQGDVLKIPIAHGEGNYFWTHDKLATLDKNEQVVFRYCDSDGNINEESNPNGSADNIAALCNKQGNVVGMMPHPERCSEELMGGADGRLIFESVIASIKNGK